MLRGAPHTGFSPEWLMRSLNQKGCKCGTTGVTLEGLALTGGRPGGTALKADGSRFYVCYTHIYTQCLAKQNPGRLYF